MKNEIHRQTHQVLALAHTGTHRDLFGKSICRCIGMILYSAFFVLHLDLLSLSVICLLSATSQYSSTVSSTLSFNPRQTSASQEYGRVIPCRMASNAHAALLHSLYQALSRFFLELFDSTRQFTHSALNRIGNRRFADPLRFRNFNITHAKNIAGIDALRLFIRKH